MFFANIWLAWSALRGQVGRAEDRDAVFDDRFVGLGQLAVAAALGRQVDDHRAGRHAAHRVGGDRARGDCLPGIAAVVMHDVAAGDDVRPSARAACDKTLRPAALA